MKMIPLSKPVSSSLSCSCYITSGASQLSVHGTAFLSTWMTFFTSTQETSQSICCTIFYSSVSCIPNSRTLFSPTESLTNSPTAWSSPAPLTLPRCCCSSQLFWPPLLNTQTTEVSMCEQCKAFKAKPTVINGIRALKGKIMVYGRGRKKPLDLSFFSLKRGNNVLKRKI